MIFVNPRSIFSGAPKSLCPAKSFLSQAPYFVAFRIHLVRWKSTLKKQARPLMENKIFSGVVCLKKSNNPQGIRLHLFPRETWKSKLCPNSFVFPTWIASKSSSDSDVIWSCSIFRESFRKEKSMLIWCILENKCVLLTISMSKINLSWYIKSLNKWIKSMWSYII